MKKKSLKLKSIKNDNLIRKVALSFLLTSVVPILVIIYLMFFSQDLFAQTHVLKITIALLIAGALAGLEIVRRIIASFLKVVEEAKKASEGKQITADLEVDEHDEIRELALSFNRINRQLQENIKELEASKKMLQNIVLKVSEAITSYEDIDKLLNLIVETIAKSLKAKQATLFLLDNDEVFLIPHISFDNAKAPQRIKVGEGVIGLVAKDSKPIILSPVGEDPSLIAVPLKYGNRLIGVIALKDKQDGQFSSDDLVLLSDLAGQTASAIENHRLHRDAETTYIQTISALAMAVEARDPYTRGHSKRMAELAAKLADGFDLDEKSRKLLGDACVLHDVGKIGTSDDILRKEHELSDAEREIIMQHPIIGENILKPIASLEPLCRIIRHHHERVDGKGYPDKLTGDKISLLTKILSVIDAYDAMTSDRPYRKAMSSQEAKQQLLKESGRHFDAQVVEKLVSLL